MFAAWLHTAMVDFHSCNCNKGEWPRSVLIMMTYDGMQGLADLNSTTTVIT